MTVTIEQNTDIQLTGFGARLKAAREALRLSEKDVAARLHLNIKIISIIENEQFENGPPMIFMRGYLRSYARVLNISDDEINVALSQLETTNPAVSVSTQRGIKPPQPTSNKLVRGMTYLIILLLITLVAMWWRNTHTNSNSSLKTINETPAETISQSNTPAPVVALNNTARSMPTVATPNTAEQTHSSQTATVTAQAPLASHAALPTPALAEPAPQLAVPTPTTASTKEMPVQLAPTPEISPAMTDIKPETTNTTATTPAEASAQKTHPTKAAPKSEPDLTEAKMELPEPGIEPGDEDAPTVDEGN
jgi:cytoskeleton protein RodZ